MSFNGLLTSHSVCADANPDSSFFIRKSDPLVLNNLVANSITCDSINLNEGILTCVENGSTLTLNGVPIGSGGGGSGTVESVAVSSPLTISGDPFVNPTIGINLSSIVQTNNNQTITGAKKFAILPQSVVGVVPTDPDEFTNKLYVDTTVASVSSIVGGLSSITDWALYPAIADINAANFRLTNVSQVETSSISSQGVLTLAGQNISIETTFIDLQKSALTDAQEISGESLNILADDAILLQTTTGEINLIADAAEVSLNGTQVNFNSKPLTNVGDITFQAPVGEELTGVFDITSPVATTITAGLALNLAAASVNIGSLGLPIVGGINLAATGAINIGSANYTSIENVRITNSLIEKEPSTADLDINNVGFLTNDLANLVIGTNNTITIAPNGTTSINTNNQNFTVSSGNGENNFAGQFFNMAATSSIVMTVADGTNNPIELRTGVANSVNIGEGAYDETSDPSSVLDIKSAGRGIYIPRLTTAARQAIPEKQSGLFCYDSQQNNLFLYSTQWYKTTLTNESNQLVQSLSGLQDGVRTRSLTGFSRMETGNLAVNTIEPLEPLVIPYVGIGADVSMPGNASLSFGLVGGGDGTISVPGGSLNIEAAEIGISSIINISEPIKLDGAFGPSGYVLISQGSALPPIYVPFVGGPVGGRITLGAVSGDTIVPASNLTWDSSTGVLV
jgi:hypothetical protein